MQKSKLVLGTVQLGMKYGLNNTSGQPSSEEALAILDTALNVGINTFDTAYAYGEAEDVLGRWIKARSLKDKINVISKLKPQALNDYPDGTKAADIVMMEIKKSLARLGLDRLDGYLLHSPYYIYLDHVVAGLKQAKAEGLVENIGISSYDEAEALYAAELSLDYIEIPYNIFDQRLRRTDFFALAKNNKVTVLARSPFLQGLLLLEPDQLPPHIAVAREPLNQFRELARKYELSPAAACLLFVNATADIACIVFGVDTARQLKESLAIIDTSPALDQDFIAEAREDFKNIDHTIISPNLWNKIKR